jgi:hypothetical protein
LNEARLVAGIRQVVAGLQLFRRVVGRTSVRPLARQRGRGFAIIHAVGHIDACTLATVLAGPNGDHIIRSLLNHRLVSDPIEAEL